MKTWVLKSGIILMFSIMGGFIAAQPAAVPPRTYCANAKMGLFVHYTLGTYHDGHYGGTWTDSKGKPATDINSVADGLDVKALASLAKGMGAQYVIFTAYHAGMNLMYPSPFWGRVFPNKVSKRDLIGDLADALKAKGIPLILYVHPDDRHDLTAEEQKKLMDNGYATQVNITQDSGRRPKDPIWQATYVRLIDEIGSRYGDRIVGYWEDGGLCDSAKVKAVMLEHTPDAAIWKNGGWSGPPATLIGSEGENRQQQWAATVAGTWWASGGKMTRTPRDMYQTTVLWAATQGQVNGGIAWSAGPYVNNEWETGVAEAFKELGQLMRANGKAIYGTVASTSYVTSPVAQPHWGVATDSADGSSVYLHVFNSPKDTSLQIGKATDGRVFDRATLLSNGKAVKLTATDDGYVLTLPKVQRWSEVDTVVCLAVKK
jgi:alpha-L-fucosidase